MRGDRACPAGGAQPHVNVIKHAVVCPRGEGADQPLGKAREILRAMQRSRRRRNPDARDRNRTAGSGRDPMRPSSRGCQACPWRGSRSADPDPAVLGREPIRHQAMHGIDDALRHVGECDAGLLGGHRAGQDSRADQEQTFLTEQTQADRGILHRNRHRPAVAASRADSSRWSGIAPKKRGSISPSMICGCRASMSPRRGAAPRISATSATRSRFWLRREISRPPRCNAWRNRSNACHRAVRLFRVRKPVDQRRDELDKGVPGRFDPNTRYSPAIHCRTVSATISGFLNPRLAR